MISARATRTLLSLLALLLASGALALPSAAQDEPGELDEPAEVRERNRARQEETCGPSLDLAARLRCRARGPARRAGHRDRPTTPGPRRAACARQRAAERELEGLEADVRAAERVDRRRSIAESAAAGAYVRPLGGGIEVLLGTEDITELHEKSVMIGQVAEVDPARCSRNCWPPRVLPAEQQRAVDAARAEAAEARRAAEAALADVRARRAEQTEVERALAVRIAEFEDEAAALGAQEARLTSLIEEQQAAAAAATTTTTSVASPTTASAPADGADPCADPCACADPDPRPLSDIAMSPRLRAGRSPGPRAVP
ncbi:MAG: hypothetical protein U5R31_02930, partial [Acidimicrobiia bacterium]|nr:hypothetical protein [Acidimicrobiia bacterium]